MKKIEAIIRKTKFDAVAKALMTVEVRFFSYWDVTGSGHEKAEYVYRGVNYDAREIQRVMLSIVVSDSFVERTINAIMEAARTGAVGDGKIFVTPVEQVYRIRNTDADTDALQ